MNGSLTNGLLGQLQGAPTSQIAQQLGIDPATAQNAIASALPLIMGTLGHHAQQPGGASTLLQALRQGQTAQDAPDSNSDSDSQEQSNETNNGIGSLLGRMLGSLAGNQQGQSGGLGGLGGLLGSMLSNSTNQLGQSSSAGGLGGLLGVMLKGNVQSNPQQNTSDILSSIFGNAQSHAQNGLGQATGLGAEKARQLMQILAPIALSHIAQHVQNNNLDANGLNTALSREQNTVQTQGGLIGNLLGSVLNRI
jgi:hypothetical protein